MKTHIIEKIVSLLDTEIRQTQVETTKGLLFVPNDDMIRGPSYLIRVNDALETSEVDWGALEMYMGGGNAELIKSFFGQCNGFAFVRHFSAPGILTHDPYDGCGYSNLNIPYDLRGNSHGSYPQFAPTLGYFLSQLSVGKEYRDLCDVITPDGQIIYGYFREDEAILGHFDDFDSWLETRVPQAVKEAGLLGS